MKLYRFWCLRLRGEHFYDCIDRDLEANADFQYLAFLLHTTPAQLVFKTGWALNAVDVLDGVAQSGPIRFGSLEWSSLCGMFSYCYCF
jgi:hypothetical protein